MKKSVKRILCSALSLAMCSTLVVESALRLHAESNTTTGTTATADAAFTNVTGKYDTSKLREQNFNSSVLKAEDVAPRYETRTVMVSLSKAPILERAEDVAVATYLDTWSGERAKAEIATEQENFLQALKKKGIPFKVEHTYNTVLNGLALELDTKYVSTIKQMQGVDSVVITTAYSEPQTADTSSHDVVTNKTDVYETGIYDSSKYAEQYGEGMVVAVLDTGLDYTHNAFQGFENEVTPAWSKEVVKEKLSTGDLAAEKRSGSLDVSDVYMSAKVPFTYDYADDDPDVYPSYSNHGTHVAGIIGGYDPSGYTDKDGNPITDKKFLGVVPDAQLVICKVFTDDLDDPDLGGAVSEDIVAALEDCVTLGVDVINMSLGSSCGFTTTNDGDDEGEMLNKVYESVRASGISLICAASNDYSAGYGGVYGTNLASNPDAGTVGSPSTYPGALSVASINGQKASYLVANEGSEKESYVFFEEARDINSNPFDFVKGLNEQYPNKNGVFEYVVVPGVGHAADYSASIKSLFKDENGNKKGVIALVKRGDTTFQEKVEVAMEMGAAGVIVYNNVAGTIRMNLGEIENPVPSVSISMNAGNAMANISGRVGVFTIGENFAAGPFMSEFSSWGPTPDLKLKPEITAHGGEITSAVPGGYGEQSGTSMATPNMAGFMAIIRSYIIQELGGVIDTTKATEINRLAMQLTMSTAGTVYDQDGLPYSPRKQGAGVAKMENIVDDVIGTKAYLWTDVPSNDYRPKIELGDDPEKEGVYNLEFQVTNFGGTALTFEPAYEFMTETLSSDKLTVSEQAHMLTDSDAEWKADGKALSGETVTVAAGKTMKISVTLTLGEGDRNYIDESFVNGMYVEGFLKLLSQTENQCDLTVPFLGFYGDWGAAPMLDYSAYEVAANEQDASVLEEDKIKASVWATQPYNIYYNDKYVLPMGGYLYLLPEEDEPMYVDEEHNAVSRYNEYYGEGNVENYMTTTGLKAVYAGLLRNARTVNYCLIDESTGEAIIVDSINRVAKAYSGGGSAVPANVKLEIYPEEEGFIANGKYRMEFDFYREKLETGDTRAPDDTYEFSFTVDYEAPIMEDARIRYYTYKDGNKEKQRIYLDIDVYDNHYAQTVLVCYPKTDKHGNVSLQLATEFPTPVRNAVKNGVTTVSVEITDIYEQYGDQLYIQIDDYALNTCLWQVDASKANASMLPEAGEFSLGNGEKSVNVDIYGTHKVSLVYGESYAGEGDASNFLWTSANPRIANVKNGEIVGLSEGKTKIFVSNRKGSTKTIDVTVSGSIATSLPKVPSLSFGVIQTESDALQKASGVIEVAAGDHINLVVQTDPWYHPMTDLQMKWTSSNESVATVTQNGEVTTIKKGTAVISAVVQQKNGAGEWVDTLYSAMSIMQVQDEFTVSNYTLTKYSGLGGVVTIPTDRNIMYIGEEAFKENDNITKIIIPSSVVDIRPRAFYECTALEEVYFVSEEKLPIADADVSMIYEYAFYGCTNLRKIDFSNTKTVTVAQECFVGCTNLTEVVDMPSIGTMHHRAFAGTALESVDLSGLHMSGNSVFEGCQSLTSIKTGKFTAIGEYMFRGCLGLRDTVLIKTPKIGTGAFSGCSNLSGVKLDAADVDIEFDIGARAFENCGKNLKGNFSVELIGGNVRSIGARAFAGSSLKNFDFAKLSGLEVLGENAFANTQLTQIALTDSVDLTVLRLTGIPFGGLTLTVDNATSQKYLEENGVIYTKDKKKLLHVNGSVTGEFTLPVGVEEIGEYAFANSAVTKVTLSDSLSALGVGAFKNSKLTEIVFAENTALAEIPASVFEGSTLKSILLPASVTSIGAKAFAGSALSAFQGEGVLVYGNSAFEGCNALTSIRLADGNGEAVMGDEVFSACVSLTSVTLPSLKELGRYTFYGCGKLESVTFGAKSSTTGTYTFVRTPIQSVTLGALATTIGEATFYECANLESVTLPENCVKVETAAFIGCRKLSTVNGVENVEYFGMQSFYNTALTALNLESAKQIEYMAFAEYESADETQAGTATYTSLSMPKVESLANYAFFNSGISEVTLPASLKTIGIAVFASSDKLTKVEVASGNQFFFAEDNVVYRYTDKKENNEEYELVFYPSARLGEGEKGSRAYTVKEGTVRILAYAFYMLNANVLNEVTLPYSVNAIGDSAFFVSGVTKYNFESIVAPTLETSYRQEVRDVISQQSTIAEYKGYYNTNFQTYLYHFTRFGAMVSPLSMTYPSNGFGYDNPIYTMYFGERTPSEVDLLEDDTRVLIKAVQSMYTAEEVKAWVSLDKTEENETMVRAFAETMKNLRVYYNNAMKSEGQKAYITQELEEKLLGVEAELRDVKKAFGIPFIVKELLIAEDSTHKTAYNVGDTFDMTGLSLIVVYDDYSTEVANPAKFQLLNSGALGQYDKYVEVRYESARVRVPVTVTGSTVTDSSVSSSNNEGGKKGCKSALAMGALVPMLAMVAIVADKRKRK